MRFSMVMVIALVGLALSASVAGADETWRNLKSERGPAFESQTQLAFGVGHRLDGEADLDAQSTLTGDILFSVSESVTIKTGFQYNHHTQRRMVSTHYWSWHAGPRFQIKKRLISPFGEILLGFHRYEVQVEDYEYDQTKAALILSGGLSFSLGGGNFLDVSLRLVTNHVEQQVMAVTAPLELPPDDQSFVWSWGPIWQNYENSLYNPITLEVQYRVGL